MAANYWASTQYLHWQYSRETLAQMRQKLKDEEKHLNQLFPLPDMRYLSCFFSKRETRLLDHHACGSGIDRVQNWQG